MQGFFPVNMTDNKTVVTVLEFKGKTCATLICIVAVSERINIVLYKKE